MRKFVAFVSFVILAGCAQPSTMPSAHGEMCPPGKSCSCCKDNMKHGGECCCKDMKHGG